MKKLLAVIAIASFAVACNNKSDKKKAEDTTTVAPVDTTVVAPTVDTTKAVVDTAKAADTSKPK